MGAQRVQYRFQDGPQLLGPGLRGRRREPDAGESRSAMPSSSSHLSSKCQYNAIGVTS